jgi:hypothetical protein
LYQNPPRTRRPAEVVARSTTFSNVTTLGDGRLEAVEKYQVIMPDRTTLNRSIVMGHSPTPHVVIGKACHQLSLTDTASRCTAPGRADPRQ